MRGDECILLGLVMELSVVCSIPTIGFRLLQKETTPLFSTESSFEILRVSGTLLHFIAPERSLCCDALLNKMISCLNLNCWLQVLVLQCSYI